MLQISGAWSSTRSLPGRKADLRAPPPRIGYRTPRATAAALVLVRDRGVYLLSNEQPRDLVEGERSFVAYAQGCDPYRDRDWRSNSRDLAGDDDFSLTLPWAHDLKALIEAGVRTIVVRIARNADRIEVAVQSDA